MNNQTFPAAAKSMIETSRSTLVNAIDAGCETTQRTLSTYDKLFKAGSNAIARAPIAITSELRDELISIESQLSLIANILAHGAAGGATEGANRLARMATDAAGSFEQVFDLRVMQALDHLGVPISMVVRELADRVAIVTREIEQLIKIVQIVPTEHTATRKASRGGKSRARNLRRVTKHTGKTAA